MPASSNGRSRDGCIGSGCGKSRSRRPNGGSGASRHFGLGQSTSSSGCCRRYQIVSREAAAVEVRRLLSAKPERVFSAFTDAEIISRWLTPSPEISLTVLAFEFRVGGAYRFEYHVPDGKVMVVNGIYRLIEPPSRIVFSWNIEPPGEHAGLRSEVTVGITP